MTSATSVTPIVTFTTAHSDSEASEFILPDLLRDCHYPLRQNPYCEPVSRASEQWLLDEVHLQEPDITAFMGLRAGELAAAVHPDADPFHLQVCTDFMNWLFNIDDEMELDAIKAREMRECCMSALRDPINFHTEMIGGKLCKSYFSRFRATGGPRCTERFINTMDLFFIAVAKQVDNRAKGHISDLETYITARRDTSACKPSFALIEYAAGIDLPDEVVSHPVIMAMEEATNDLVTWSNDMCSYNVEQCRHDTHNMISVLMCQRGLDLQDAVDYVGQLCKGSIQRFEDNRTNLPSWGEEVDRQVDIYVDGLQNWIVGSLHWSFECTRYFGKDGQTVKRDLIIKLLPKKAL